MKKLITELSTEELLENASKAEEILPENDIIKFISFYNIKSGKDKVTIHLLYYIYSHWSKEKISKSIFAREMGFFFVKDQGKLLVSMSDINFSKKAIELLQKKDKTKIKSFKTHFENFLNKYNLIPDQYNIKNWIEDFSLY